MQSEGTTPPAGTTRAQGTMFRTSVFRAAGRVAIVGILALAATAIVTSVNDTRERVRAKAELVASALSASAATSASADDAGMLARAAAAFGASVDDTRVCIHDARGALVHGNSAACATRPPRNDAGLFAPFAHAATITRSTRADAAGALVGTVAVSVPPGHVLPGLVRHTAYFILASLLVAAYCMYIATRYARRQGAEIERVRAAANAMRAGAVPAAGSRPDTVEFAELLDAINATAAAVRGRIADAEREIAERQRAEAALVASENRIRRMIDEVPQAVFAVSPDGQLLLVNRRLAQLYGRTPGELLTDPAPLLDDPWLTSAPTVLIGSGADSRVLEVHRVPFPLEGEAPGTLVVGNDVTEARHLQMQLNQASRMHAIGQLAGGVAHEFNNLLTPINGHAELLRSRLHDPDLQRPLDAITGAATRARQLIRQVLSFSRTTEQLFERTPTAIGAVIEEVALLMRGSLPSSIEFRVQVERGLPLVLADPGQLHQVLVNLCTNAAHAIDGLNAASQDSDGEHEAGFAISGRRGGRIDVIADAIHADDLPPELAGQQVSGVRIRVLDNGAGMAPAVMARVFEPFFSTKPGDQGTGLGLAVAKGIIEAHGGQIRVDSSPGWATCFEIVLPGAPSEEHADDTNSSVTHEPSSPQARHVLIVDDDAAVLLVTGEMLRALGYDVTTAGSGERALELLRGAALARVDLVITDNSMPGMDGHTLARRLRAQYPQLPIVMLTGLMDTDDDATSAINLQLMKPVGMAELDRAIGGLLASSE